jgi:histidine triad (HIT) family protein
MDCIFCRIAGGEIASDILHEDEEIIAIRDLNPQAPVHILVMPRRHVASLADVTEEESGLVGRMAAVANRLAKSEGIAERGYRIAVNCGEEGGQTVGHLHMHLLGGRQLSGQLG